MRLSGIGCLAIMALAGMLVLRGCTGEATAEELEPRIRAYQRQTMEARLRAAHESAARVLAFAQRDSAVADRDTAQQEMADLSRRYLQAVRLADSLARANLRLGEQLDSLQRRRR